LNLDTKKVKGKKNMADIKKEYSSEEVKVLIDINMSLANIVSSLDMIKDTMDDLVEMEKKNGLDLQVFSERIKALQYLYNTLSVVVKEIKDKIVTLTAQLAYQERVEIETAIIKQKDKKVYKENTNKSKNIFSQIMQLFNFIGKNIKWIAIILIAVVIIAILITGGNEALKNIIGVLTSIAGGDK